MGSWLNTPYKIDGKVALRVFFKGQAIASFTDVHSFNADHGGVLWVVTDGGKSVDAWAAHAWDHFQVGEG
jgi:hypothetical protein